MTESSYVYSDDSRFFGEVLSRQEGGESFLEIGVGNGGNIGWVADKFKLVVGTDINDLRVARTRAPENEFILADRATCFRELSFDVVAFNPPYVPSNEVIDKTVDGGPNGIEIPLEFLKSALKVIKRTGRILVLLSSEDSMNMFHDFCDEHDLSVRRLDERNLFFEKLVVYELKVRRA